ncbi:sugar phosphate nucleotidyltransferase [Kushneria aurantia]|uniref:Nucleotidyltransferase family protein n=1 Tax=Kushneria aurantia TaxID=504092 RepID=A0ABV6G4W3_9GAMM
MILAAGRGSRMGELTAQRPKPLLEVGGRALIDYHIERLAHAGVDEIAINVSYLGEQIVAALGERRYGVPLTFSREASRLETAGGIRHALALLGSAPFWLVNADIWCDLCPARLGRQLDGDLARLVMVDPPDHHPDGDFHLDAAGRLHADGAPKLVYAGMALIDPALVAALPDNMPMRLSPCLSRAITDKRLGGYHHRGEWSDIGTPERLAALEAALAARSETGHGKR